MEAKEVFYQFLVEHGVFFEFVHELQKRENNVGRTFEEFLKEISIPVKSEMDGLYKTVYDLKKDVRKLKKEIEVLRKGPTEPGKEQVKPKGIETL